MRSRSTSLRAGIRLAAEAVRFAVTGRGALTFGVTSAQVFCRSREELASPDLQLLFTPASYDAARFGAAGARARHDGGGLPGASRTAAARSWRASPIRSPRRSSRRTICRIPNDQRVLNAGMRITRHIFAAPAMAQHSVEETLPGPTSVSDEDLPDYARRYGTTIFHPVGTCRMGEGPSAVVDSRLRVHGIGGLRVIDASVMPTLTTGNTNAPTIMIAEKGAAMIREDARLGAVASLAAGTRRPRTATHTVSSARTPSSCASESPPSSLAAARSVMPITVRTASPNASSA